MGPTTPRNGRTIVQALLEEGWKELDTIVEHIMSHEEPDAGEYNDGVEYQDIQVDEFREACVSWGEWRGQAQGVAYMLAMLINPYAPDVDAIRKEAMRRWEAGEDE